jgi:hypothetical protein
MASMIPYECASGAVTTHWASRFADEYHLEYGSCGIKKTTRRKDMTKISRL